MGYQAAKDMATLLTALTVASLISLMVCYFWGRLIGRTARRMQASQWRAYTAALFPFGALMASLLWHDALVPVSVKAFFGLGSPAIIGAFQRWHRGPAFAARPLRSGF
jgi:hypothetical protein